MIRGLIGAGAALLVAAGLYAVKATTVTVSPGGTVRLSPSQTMAFTATVANKANKAVTWSLSPAVGTISADGLYTAPQQLDSAETITVTANSVGDARASGATKIWLSGPVPATFFGMAVLNFPHLGPSMRFGTTRSWDAGPGLDWSSANPSAGTYNLAPLDQFIEFNRFRGTEGIYTFGRTPRWASSKPDDPMSPYGPGQCAPPARLSDWDNYVTAIVTRAAGRIRYWELWNEPNENSYCGDVATLVTMAQHAHAIIKRIDPSALILTPSADKASGPSWLQAFLSAGGAKVVDVIAFHGYWSAQPEDIGQVVEGFRAAAHTNGLDSLPLWDTESSWAYTSNMPLPPIAQQTGYIARSYLLHWSLGVARSAWYAYDANSPWGTMYTTATGETAAAMAYAVTYQWMVGATLTVPCTENPDHVWTCQLTRPGGYTAEAVWSSRGTSKLAVPKPYTQYMDLTGVARPVTHGTVEISGQPILLQNSTLPGQGLSCLPVTLCHA